MAKLETTKRVTINQRAKLTAQDLSLLNGVSEKINTEYLKNLEQILVYNVAELVRNGAEEIEVDFPFVGTICIRRRLQNTTKKSDGPSYSFSFGFRPGITFAKSIQAAFENGTSDLPDMLADKYGKKLLNMYEKFLGE